MISTLPLCSWILQTLVKPQVVETKSLLISVECMRSVSIIVFFGSDVEEFSGTLEVFLKKEVERKNIFSL